MVLIYSLINTWHLWGVFYVYIPSATTFLVEIYF